MKIVCDSSRIRCALAITLLTLLAALAVLNLFPFSASDEWLYTLKWINRIAGFAAALLLIFAARRRWPVFCICASAGFFIIPCLSQYYTNTSWQWQYFLSACWSCGLLFLGLFMFCLSGGGKLREWLCAGAGSVAIGLAAIEFCLLFTAQTTDGIVNMSAHSRYASRMAGIPEYEGWTRYQCGVLPGPPGKAVNIFHKLTKFDDDLFDVFYSLNEAGWRKLPENRNATNNLILFGCSLTFGYGLPDEQTWAWQLAEKLGSGWQLENYSVSSYGANQMLCLLEHELVKRPGGKRRYALFLALKDHLRRNEFFGWTPHYQLEDTGKAIEGGKHKYQWIHNLTGTLNGSQLAREAGSRLMGLVMEKDDEPLNLYLAMLAQSAAILRDKYDTKLIVLLWPDFETIKARIEALGIPVIMAKAFLPDWDKGDKSIPGEVYRIHPLYEPHPNQKASRELATGLAAYFDKLAKNSQNGN